MHDASFLMIFLRARGQNSKSLYSNTITTWCFDLPLTAIAVYLGCSFNAAYHFLYRREVLGLILLYIGYKNEHWISDLKNNCIMASKNTTIANN